MERTAELEALRRRLYRPGASEADRARYAALAGPAPKPAAPPPPVRPRRAPALLAALATVVLVIAGVAAAHALAPREARPAAAVAPVTATPTPESIVLTVNGATETAQPVRGTGAAVVELDTTALSSSGRSITVLLTGSDHRPLGWRAIRLHTRRDWTSYPQELRSSPAEDRLAATTPEVLDYTGDPPRWIRVQAPADAAWTLTVSARR